MQPNVPNPAPPVDSSVLGGEDVLARLTVAFGQLNKALEVMRSSLEAILPPLQAFHDVLTAASSAFSGFNDRIQDAFASISGSLGSGLSRFVSDFGTGFLKSLSSAFPRDFPTGPAAPAVSAPQPPDSPGPSASPQSPFSGVSQSAAPGAAASPSPSPIQPSAPSTASALGGLAGGAATGLAALATGIEAVAGATAAAFPAVTRLGEAMTELVGKAQPDAFRMFTNALGDSQAALGDSLVPGFQVVTDVIRTAADSLANFAGSIGARGAVFSARNATDSPDAGVSSNLPQQLGTAWQAIAPTLASIGPMLASTVGAAGASDQSALTRAFSLRSGIASADTRPASASEEWNRVADQVVEAVKRLPEELAARIATMVANGKSLPSPVDALADAQGVVGAASWRGLDAALSAAPASLGVSGTVAAGR